MNTSIDFVILTFEEDKLKVLLINRNEKPFLNHWAIPGNLATPNENITESVNNKLLSIFNNKIPHHKQIQTFGNANRHPDGHVITICYYVLINKSNFKINVSGSKKWVDINLLPHLAFDHETLIETCVNKIKKNIKIAPVALHLLPKHFKLSEIAEVYISLLDKKIDKRNFLRKLKDLNIITNSGIIESGVKHRPAELYTFDVELYRKLISSDKDFRLP